MGAAAFDGEAVDDPVGLVGVEVLAGGVRGDLYAGGRAEVLGEGVEGDDPHAVGGGRGAGARPGQGAAAAGEAGGGVGEPGESAGGFHEFAGGQLGGGAVRVLGVLEEFGEEGAAHAPGLLGVPLGAQVLEEVGDGGEGGPCRHAGQGTGRYRGTGRTFFRKSLVTAN
ncbi:hypothetical protein AB0948_30185 [Streptomyces koyangensis]|uniref:hypothetical protein n=1 Tax=Streptomyces koyangensis TaxID=188770 RepID=UPI003454E5E2